MAKVLIVDDDITTAKALAMLLSRDGYQSIVAFNGTEAMAHLAMPDPAHVVLLDVMMPDIDGIEILRRVRADPRTTRIPVIMYSAMSDPQTVARARNFGATDYWVKASLTFAEIQQKLATHLERTG